MLFSQAFPLTWIVAPGPFASGVSVNFLSSLAAPMHVKAVAFGSKSGTSLPPDGVSAFSVASVLGGATVDVISYVSTVLPSCAVTSTL